MKDEYSFFFFLFDRNTFFGGKFYYSFVCLIGLWVAWKMANVLYGLFTVYEQATLLEVNKRRNRLASAVAAKMVACFQIGNIWKVNKRKGRCLCFGRGPLWKGRNQNQTPLERERKKIGNKKRADVNGVVTKESEKKAKARWLRGM